ncbi:MAG: TetR/AcrR family transcriptional regulator [Oscillospiraceae bacterium]
MPSQTFLNLPTEKRDRILQAAIKEFGQRGVNEANLSNIVKDAEIARGSLYQYFPTKDDLYVYVFETLREQRALHTEPAYELYKKDTFLNFFETFYLLDSEYLLANPSHINLGIQLYSQTHGVARGLIQRQQTKYKETFLIAIEFDKERDHIDKTVDSSILADLCVHFVTDIFIFQSVNNQLSMANIKQQIRETLAIIERGILPQSRA